MNSEIVFATILMTVVIIAVSGGVGYAFGIKSRRASINDSIVQTLTRALVQRDMAHATTRPPREGVPVRAPASRPRAMPDPTVPGGEPPMSDPARLDPPFAEFGSSRDRPEPITATIPPTD